MFNTLSRRSRALVAILSASVLIVLATVVGPATSVGALPSSHAASSAPPVPSAGRGAIYGVVTHQDGPDWDGPLTVALYNGNTLVSSVTPDESGAFEFLDLLPQRLSRVAYVYGGTHGWATTYWAPPGQPAGAAFELAAGDVFDATGVLARAASVSGTVSALSPFGLTAPEVRLVRQGRYAGLWTNDKPVLAVDPATGTYTFSGVGPGVYRVDFRDDTSPVNLRTSWTGVGGETSITVDPGDDLVGIDAILPMGSALMGTVLGDDGAGHLIPVPGATVWFSGAGTGSGSALSDSLGQWVISLKNQAGPMSGEVRVVPDTAGPNVLPGVWDDGAGGSTVTTVPGAISSGFTVTLARGATITGTIVDAAGHTPAGVVEVVLQQRSGDGFHGMGYAEIDPNGRFRLQQIVAGDYILEFIGPEGETAYFDGESVRQNARIISVATGVDVALGDVVYVGGSRVVDRISGSDRYATAVAITRRAFPDGGPIPVVYIANGSGFADALSAGPAAAAHGGALLLAGRDSVPANVIAELHRLDPERIVLVGATAAISPSVASVLNSEFPGRVDRIGGADRYMTSELIVRDAFPGGVDHVFVATGRTFPDALAASAAAGASGAAVVLVDGAADGLSEAAHTLIGDLGPGSLSVVGGPNAISSGVVGGLGSASPGLHFVVFAGVDRYDTAVQIANWYGGGHVTDIAYLASGENFPDALAGGPLAAVSEGALLLVARTCVPAAAVRAIDDHDINQVTLLGGTAALTARVEALAAC